MAKALPWQHTAWEGMERRTRKCMWKCIGELIGNIQGKHRVVCPPKLGVCSEVLGSSLGFRGDAGKMQGEQSEATTESTDCTGKALFDCTLNLT